MNSGKKAFAGIAMLTGLGLIGYYLISRYTNGGNGNGPPPNGNETCYDQYPIGSPELCRCIAEEEGWNSYEFADLRVTTCPMIFSLISNVPDFPKNPEQYIIIEARDKCGQPKSNVDIWLSQSTTQWGGFVIPGYNNVNCAENGEILIGQTDNNGRMKVRYLCHHNPGIGVAETIYVFIKGAKERIINQSCMITINGTNPAWPFDPHMVTKEYSAGSAFTWYDCGL